jgi:hypothetical protein
VSFCNSRDRRCSSRSRRRLVSEMSGLDNSVDSRGIGCKIVATKEVQVKGIGHRASDIGHRTLGIGHRTSGIGHRDPMGSRYRDRGMGRHATLIRRRPRRNSEPTAAPIGSLTRRSPLSVVRAARQWIVPAARYWCPDDDATDRLIAPAIHRGLLSRRRLATAECAQALSRGGRCPPAPSIVSMRARSPGVGHDGLGSHR